MSMSTKYHARPTEYGGVRYASKAEARRAAELDLLVRAGKVAWWLRQVPVDIGEPGVDLPFKVDFLVAESVKDYDGYGGHLVVHAEDVKGHRTPQFERRVRQWRKRGPFPLHVFGGGNAEVIEGAWGEETTGVSGPESPTGGTSPAAGE